MDTVTIHSAITTISQLLARVEAGEEIVLARGKVPIAKLVPYQPVVPKREFGALREVISVGPEFCEPLPEDELAAGESALSTPAGAAISNSNNEVFVSAATAREIATKFHLGRCHLRTQSEMQ